MAGGWKCVGFGLLYLLVVRKSRQAFKETIRSNVEAANIKIS